MIVTNSSCLIILQRLGKQDLLEEIFNRIVIPRAVNDEVFKQDFRISEETYKNALVLAEEERNPLKDEPPGLRSSLE